MSHSRQSPYDSTADFLADMEAVLQCYMHSAPHILASFVATGRLYNGRASLKCPFEWFRDNIDQVGYSVSSSDKVNEATVTISVRLKDDPYEYFVDRWTVEIRP